MTTYSGCSRPLPGLAQVDSEYGPFIGHTNTIPAGFAACAHSMHKRVAAGDAKHNILDRLRPAEYVPATEFAGAKNMHQRR